MDRARDEAALIADGRIGRVAGIADALLERLDQDRRMSALYG